MNLGAEHHGGEGEEQEGLQTQENEEHDSHRRGEITTLCNVHNYTGITSSAAPYDNKHAKVDVKVSGSKKTRCLPSNKEVNIPLHPISTIYYMYACVYV